MDILTVYLTIISYLTYPLWALHESVDDCLRYGSNTHHSDVEYALRPLALLSFAFVSYAAYFFYHGGVDTLKNALTHYLAHLGAYAVASVSGGLSKLFSSTSTPKPEETIAYWKAKHDSLDRSVFGICIEKQQAIDKLEEITRMNHCLRRQVAGLQKEMLDAGARTLPKACFKLYPETVSEDPTPMACSCYEAMKQTNADAEQLKSSRDAAVARATQADIGKNEEHALRVKETRRADDAAKASTKKQQRIVCLEGEVSALRTELEREQRLIKTCFKRYNVLDSQHQAQRQEIKDLKAEKGIYFSAQRVKALEIKLANTQRQLRETQEELDIKKATDAERPILKKAVDEPSWQVEALETELAETKSELKKTQHQLDTKREALKGVSAKKKDADIAVINEKKAKEAAEKKVIEQNHALTTEIEKRQAAEQKVIEQSNALTTEIEKRQAVEARITELETALTGETQVREAAQQQIASLQTQINTHQCAGTTAEATRAEIEAAIEMKRQEWGLEAQQALEAAVQSTKDNAEAELESTRKSAQKIQEAAVQEEHDTIIAACQIEMDQRVATCQQEVQRVTAEKEQLAQQLAYGADQQGFPSKNKKKLAQAETAIKQYKEDQERLLGENNKLIQHTKEVEHELSKAKNNLSMIATQATRQNQQDGVQLHPEANEALIEQLKTDLKLAQGKIRDHRNEVNKMQETIDTMEELNSEGELMKENLKLKAKVGEWERKYTGLKDHDKLEEYKAINEDLDRRYEEEKVRADGLMRKLTELQGGKRPMARMRKVVGQREAGMEP